jgi:hypothetical protein
MVSGHMPTECASQSQLSRIPISFLLQYTAIVRTRILPVMMVLDQLLRKTEQSIADVVNRIEVQRAIVAKMERAGSEVRAARELLRALQKSHQTLVVHWKQLRGTLRSPARGTRNDFQRLAARLVEPSARPIDGETEIRLRVAVH